jgi:hypothetical protein
MQFPNVGPEPNPYDLLMMEPEERAKVMDEYSRRLDDEMERQDKLCRQWAAERAIAAIAIFSDWLNPCDDASVSFAERGLRTDAPDEAKAAYAKFLDTELRQRAIRNNVSHGWWLDTEGVR